ncbi:MAG: hypothetical protein OEY29_12645 [Gammaproteobacteria bacterium]|nr:hypothetical protein [Gammaproteobacteria bacterium]
MKRIILLTSLLSASLLQASCDVGDTPAFGTGADTTPSTTSYVNSTSFFILASPQQLGAVVTTTDATSGLTTTTLTEKTSVITVRVGDRDNFFIGDSITVYFATDYGFLSDSYCVTTDGSCSITYTTGDLNARPGDDKAYITAYTQGEESFLDLNNNNALDDGESFTDTDTPFIDNDHNGTWTANVDIPVGAIPYQGYDGVFSGETCLDTTGRCASSTTTYIYDLLELNLSN